jgi:hypothetical protein
VVVQEPLIIRSATLNDASTSASSACTVSGQTASCSVDAFPGDYGFVTAFICNQSPNVIPATASMSASDPAHLSFVAPLSPQTLNIVATTCGQGQTQGLSLGWKVSPSAPPGPLMLTYTLTR